MPGVWEAGLNREQAPQMDAQTLSATNCRSTAREVNSKGVSASARGRSATKTIPN